MNGSSTFFWGNTSGSATTYSGVIAMTNDWVVGGWGGDGGNDDRYAGTVDSSWGTGFPLPVCTRTSFAGMTYGSGRPSAEGLGDTKGWASLPTLLRLCLYIFALGFGCEPPAQHEVSQRACSQHCGDGDDNPSPHRKPSRTRYDAIAGPHFAPQPCAIACLD